MTAIPINPYIGTLFFVLGESKKSSKFIASEFDNSFDLTLADGYSFYDTDKKKYCIWLRSRKGIKDGSLAHEVVHIANQILKRSGWKYSATNDEPMAYLVQDIFCKITNSIKGK